MENKKFVLNADDFGMSDAYNKAVLEGYECGILKSTSLTANGTAFDNAIKKVIPNCQDLGIGVHLNIIEGKSLLKDLNMLTDVNGNFNNSYGQLILKAYTNTNFLSQVEEEFRAQIEKVKNSGVEIYHLDSHVHTHAIPPIFNIVCRLAKEYGVSQVRTQFELPYIVPDIDKHINFRYPINLIKILLLNTFTYINKPKIEMYGLTTNDYILGVGYTSMMDGMTVAYGLEALKNKSDIVVEALIHPCRYEDGTIDNHFYEYKITKNAKLKERIKELGFEIINYKK